MKPNRTFSILTSLFAAFFLNACQPQKGEMATPQSGCEMATAQSSCKIKTFASSYTTSPATTGVTGQSETVYEYDVRGNLTRSAASNKAKNNNDDYQFNESIATTFSYDADGYLTTKIAQNDRQDAGRNTKTTTTTRYVYDNDRKLTTATETNSGSYNQTTVYSYEYDKAGKLSKFVTKTNSQKTTHTYSDCQLTAVTQLNANGIATQIYTVINGMVTKQATSTDTYSVYAYNSQKQLTKSEQFVDGKLNYYYEMTPIEAKSATESLPAFKGHPALLPLTGKTGLFDSFKFYAVVKSTMTQMNESTYKYSVNAKGFVINAVWANKVLDQVPYTTNVTETYNYTDCQ